MKTTTILLSFLLTLSSAFATGFKGTYTIDPGKPASLTNYISFNDADSDLVSGKRSSTTKVNGPGVKGAVIFNIADGIYHESVEFNYITGTSSTNTINFQSASKDSSKVVLSDTTANYAILLHNASYFKFNQLTLQQGGIGGFVVLIENGSNYDSFINCRVTGLIINGLPAPITLIYSNYNAGQGVIFFNNHLKYGMYGYFSSGNSSRPDRNTVFCKNVFDSISYSGIRADQQSNITILNNKISMPYGNYGLYLRNINTTYTKKNSLIANNFISVGSSTGSAVIGIYILNFEAVDLFYNNVSVHGAGGGTTFAAYLYSAGTGTKDSIYNNNFLNLNTGGRDFAMYAYNLDAEDYNNLKTMGSYVVSYSGTNYKTISAWSKSGFGLGKHDISINPLYFSNTDLHVHNPALDGKAKALINVVTDIDNVPRNSTKPDVGADEFIPQLLDPNIYAITSPSPGFCTGVQDVSITLYNFGLNTIKNVTINWFVNGTAQTPFSWSGSLASSFSTSIKIGSYNFSSTSSIYSISAFPDSVNGIAITKTSINTANINIQAGLIGFYTIDNSGKGTSDYTGIRAAVNDLNNKGVCGTVTYNIADGHYKERTIIKDFPGSSSTNTVIFQSTLLDSSKVIIDTATEGAILFINGSKHIIFRELTFSNSLISTFSTNTSVIQLGNGASNIIFENNIMNTSVGGGSSGTVLSDDYQTAENNIIVRNNHISGGIVGIRMVGSTYFLEKGNVIYHNIIDKCSDYGLLLVDQADVNISKNLINLNTGIQALRLSNDVNSNYTDTIRIANNFITTLGSNSSGLYLYNIDHAQIYNNSIFTYSKGFATYLNFAPSKGNVLINNIFSNFGTGQAIQGDSSSLFKSNYNDLYSKGNVLATWVSLTSGYSVSCADIAKWRSVSGMDKNSISSDPLFASSFSGNLHLSPYSIAVIQKGIAVASVKDDYDSEVRSNTPNIGADETKTYRLDAGITDVDSPVISFCSGTKNIFVTLSNNGADTLKSVTINWAVNGTLMTPYSWAGSIPAFSSLLINLGTLTFITGSSKIIKAYTRNPNGGIDSNNLNDTFVKVIKTGLIGSFTIGGKIPDYLNFHSAINSLLNYGVCGAVIFNIRDGSYKESVLIKQIPGSSPVNTITFQSQSLDSTKVIVDTSWVGVYDATAYTIRLDNAKYITFRKMTITNRAGNFTSYNNAIELGNGASYNIFANNIILTDGYKGLSQGAAIANDPMSVESYNILQNNIISGGLSNISYGAYYNNYGASLYERGNIIDNNQMDSSWEYGIIASLQDALRISRNTIYNFRALAGLYLYSCSAKDTSYVINNFITIADSQNYGFYSLDNQLLSVYNNSINSFTSAYYNMFSVYFAGNVACKVNAFNNIFSNSNRGFALYGDKSGLSNSDYNDIYSNGAYLSSDGSSIYSSLAGWQSASKQDKHSIAVKPWYQNSSSGDLHLTYLSTALIHKGIYLADARDDIDGEYRSLTPDLGADERHIDSNDLGVTAILSPLNNSCGNGSTIVAVKIKNFGSQDQTNFNIHVIINGTISATKVFSGTLNGGAGFTHYDTIVYISFSPALNTSTGGIYKIVAYTDLSSDTNRANDTTKTNISLNSLPDASFTHSVVPINTLSVRFYANDKTLSKYMWNFGDSAIGVDSSTTHTYITSGYYIATLIATNSNGCTATSKSDTITILITDIIEAANYFKLDIYPNPFTEYTNITYTLDKSSNVKVEVYDVVGRLVSILINHSQTVGEYKVRFDNSINPAGIYILKMTAGDKIITKQITKLN
jgi:hypothetical protein